MESKIYFTIAISSSILAFALIVATGMIPTAFVNVLAQEGAISTEGSVNDTLIDKDKGTSRSSTEFSAVNDTMSGQNVSQWTTNATLAYEQGESEDTGMTKGLGNDTGMTEGQTGPEGEGEVDLGTGRP